MFTENDTRIADEDVEENPRDGSTHDSRCMIWVSSSNCYDSPDRHDETIGCMDTWE